MISVTITVATPSEAQRIRAAIPADVKVIAVRQQQVATVEGDSFPGWGDGSIAALTTVMDWLSRVQDSKTRNRHGIDLHGKLDRLNRDNPNNPEIIALSRRLLSEVFKIETKGP